MTEAEILGYRVVKDFLETAFHTILYLRQIYPPELFQQKQKYKVPVWQSRNPTLNEYLGKIVQSISEELAKGTLAKVVFIIKESNMEQRGLERFIFDLKWLIPKEKIPELTGADFRPRENGLTRGQVEDVLRAFLLKLNTADSYLLALPPDITFAVIIELQENSPAPESTAEKKQLVPVEWVPAEERHASGGKESIDDRSSITPLRTTALGLLNLELIVEELSGKFNPNPSTGTTGEHFSAPSTDNQDYNRTRDSDRKGKARAV